MTKNTHPHVGLLVTCLVDLIRPSVGFAAVRLLENAGCHVEVPAAQTCCGQPAYNMGDSKSAAAIGRQIVEAFEEFDYVVVPSGSCAGMVSKHLPKVLKDDEQFADRARAVADKTHELISFLVDILGVEAVDAEYEGSVTYHDSCSGLRELGIKEQPRKLLRSVKGLSLNEMREPEVCCGFGGTFSVKYPDISGAIVEKKVADVSASGAPTVLAGDLGCLMNIAGRLSREGKDIKVRHVAEVLAGFTDEPPMAQGDGRGKGS